MKDSVIKGNGNSRYLKSSLEGITTWEQFRAALAAGTLPVDLNGINPEGFQQLGDPFNKASLLKDSTAAAFGLGTDAVPDDALRLMSRFQAGLGNEYVWEKHKITTVYDIGDEQDLSVRLMRFTYTDVIVYGTDYTYDDATGEYNITNPQKTTIKDYCDAHASTNGTFFQAVPTNPDQKGYSTSNVGVKNEVLKFVNPYTTSSTYCEINVSAKYRIVFKNTTDEFINFVNSPSPNAYPPAVDDGYTYRPLGQLGDKVRIATGSYTGTGTYGASNPNSLTFEFEPKFLSIVLALKGSDGYVVPNQDFLLMSNGGFASRGNSDMYGKIDENTVYWYSVNSAETQLNINGREYTYIAIG